MAWSAAKGRGYRTAELPGLVREATGVRHGLGRLAARPCPDGAA